MLLNSYQIKEVVPARKTSDVPRLFLADLVCTDKQGTNCKKNLTTLHDSHEKASHTLIYAGHQLYKKRTGKLQ